MDPELEIVDLVEAAIITDLALDSQLAPYLRGHDDAGMKGGDDEPGTDELLYNITVSAEDRGQFNYPGIQLIGVTIDVQRNLEAPDRGGLGKLCSRIGTRLPATQLADQSRHQAFCNSRLKVHGIMGTETEKRYDQDLSRERSIVREFICSQLS
jgi:hypothetical protein